MTTPALESLRQFRQNLYNCFTRRADASLNFLDALTQATEVESPVTLSESPAFERDYPSIYDVLGAADLDRAALCQTLYASQPEICKTLAGYEVYATDTTPEERPEAKTLPDRVPLKSQRDAPAVPGHKYSWLVRLVLPGRSWCAPQDVERIPSDTTSNLVATEQVRRLDQQSPQPKVVVADSGYANGVFLAVFLLVKTVVALVRLRNNQVVYQAPGPYKGKGRRPVHGPKFKLSAPHHRADREETTQLLGQTLRLQAWCNVHLYKLPALVGMVVCVEFLRPDGTRRYRYPLWLFWTGLPSVPLIDLGSMYLWRFMIEHLFRFLKQHLGLNNANMTQLHSVEQWMWLCGLAYWQLLLMAEVVKSQVPTWQRQPKQTEPLALSPRQVQRACPAFFAKLGTPAQLPRPAGKAPGRAAGFHPAPRTRYPVINKSQSTARIAATAAWWPLVPVSSSITVKVRAS